jgi:SAM-dependent methyltransferase
MSWNKNNVGEESRKSFDRKNTNEPPLPPFFSRFMRGEGLDIGYSGYIENVVPILPKATGVDMNYPGYDGRTLPFADNSQDYVYSSHCLEHIDDYVNAIREWYRVAKVGGHIVTVVPHKFLYEKKEQLPSNWNGDHKRFYTPASLLHEFEQALEPNSYRVRFLEDGDTGFDYSIPPEQHSGGEYEITLVIQKIEKPNWKIIPSKRDGRNDLG